jgi:hypothetical protein
MGRDVLTSAMNRPEEKINDGALQRVSRFRKDCLTDQHRQRRPYAVSAANGAKFYRAAE